MWHRQCEFINPGVFNLKTPLVSVYVLMQNSFVSFLKWGTETGKILRALTG